MFKRNLMCIAVFDVLLSLIAVALTEICITPNKEEGECLAVSSCPFLLDTLKTDQNGTLEYVREAACGFKGEIPLVCCPPSFRIENATKNRLIPSREYCGYQHADDYTSSRNAEFISIHEFPWLALLLMEDTNNVTRGMCAGSLINHRYVLTAAHCLMHSKYKLVGIRLGEYNVKNQTDCVEDRFYECSEPVQEFGIEKTVPHPGFSWRNFSSNIGLVRLNRTVRYSDFVRPICLPLTATVAVPGDVMTISGWAKRTINNKTVEIKKRIRRELITNTECASIYTTRPIRNDQFCTKVIDTDNELCQGDSGGPIMFSYKHQWHQEGIFTAGAKCSSPVGVHLKIVDYLDWIKESIEK